MLRAAVGQGQHHHANGQQETRGVDHPAEQGFTRILVTEPDHPYMAAWWPPGHLIGYEHSFTHEIVDLVRDVANGADPRPSFLDGLQVQLVLDAVARSAAAGSSWTEIETS